MTQKISWNWIPFNEFTPSQLYAYMQLRQQAFVVEQNCAYLDLDNLDQTALHLLGFTEKQELVACLRMLHPGQRYDDPSLGRIVVSTAWRAYGIGHELLQEGIKQVEALYPTYPLRIQAQAHLQAFYQRHEFKQQGEIYDEDGIPHIDMLRVVQA